MVSASIPTMLLAAALMTACPPEMLEDADWQASIPVLSFSKLVDADGAPRLEVSPVLVGAAVTTEGVGGGTDAQLCPIVSGAAE